MSVIVTLTMNGDPAKLEEHAQGNPDAMRAILDTAKSHGLIAHRFYGSEDGKILVIDEWPDAQSFQSFFSESRERIGTLMEAAGVSSEPQATFWRQIDSPDKYGWGA